MSRPVIEFSDLTEKGCLWLAMFLKVSAEHTPDEPCAKTLAAGLVHLENRLRDGQDGPGEHIKANAKKKVLG